VNKADRDRVNVLIIEVVRGAIVESRHRVSVAIVDSDGRQRLAFGDMVERVYLRSSAKPFQALPFVEGGFADRYDLSSRQLAIICASHTGTDEHAEVVRGILGRIGLTESNLRCGTQTPSDSDTANRLMKLGEDPSPLRHNCSGKHAGMLLFSNALHTPPDEYLLQESDVQRAILKAFSEMAEVPAQNVEVGIDGCSAPNFAVSLPAAALAYARLMDPSGFGEQRVEACRRIVHAMTSHPDMVAGKGKFDTQLMQVTNGQLLSKGGAEGYQAMGIPSDRTPGGKAMGITLKVHDGDSGKRARSVVTLELLGALGILTADERAQLARFDARPMFNLSQIIIGEIRLASESRTRLQKAHDQIRRA
jgi:L-asparaginase II